VIRATLCLDDAVGETRRALLDPLGRPFRLDIERWSERGRRAKLDDIWWGRARKRTTGGGWFVDLGLDADGVIDVTKSAVTEGALIPVRVKSEAWSDKGPALSRADMSPATPRPDGPSLHKAAGDTFAAGVTVVATLTAEAARREIDAAIEEAGQVVCAVAGGGDIAVQRTRALTAIDVDAGNRLAKGSAEDFGLALNLEAADEAARQIALRGIGGLVVADFLNMASSKSQRLTALAFREALALWLGRASDVRELSGLGLCEAAIARRARPVSDALATTKADEREGLDALRMIESAGWAARGARIRAKVSREAATWLEADSLGWKEALAGRIGQRWTIDGADRRPGPPEVWSET